MSAWLSRGMALGLALLGACVTTTSGPGGLEVTGADGQRLYRGGSSWTVRATSSSRQEVINIPGVGEVVVEDGRCRLVRSLGAGAIAIREARPGPCVEERGDRLCFVDGVWFNNAEGTDRVSVDGCAERNEIFLERVEGHELATVGPRGFFERCAPIDARSPSYVRVGHIVVENNDQPSHGLRFRYRDGFEICFLARSTGRYSVDIDVEDPAPRHLTLTGAVDEL